MSKLWVTSRSEYVAKMFSAIADHYDVMNRVMTLGQDQRWRRQAAEIANLSPGMRALDVGTGTGDLAFEVAKHVIPGGQVIGVDFAEPMLEIARRKSLFKELPVTFEAGDALTLKYQDSSFHAVTCGFGIRNVDERLRSLQEMTRVVGPNGRVVILELTPPRNLLAKTYMDQVIPRLGQVLAHAREAYTYLPESVNDFPDAEGLGRLMQQAGLKKVTYRVLNFGTIALHWGTKPG